MAALINSVTFDARDPWAIAQFWAGVLGRTIDEEEDAPGDPMVTLPGAPEVQFIVVPEAKEVKNRLHLDVEAEQGSMSDEVDRVLALGATLVADFRRPDGAGWVTLQDPEGNEFCVVRNDAERAVTG